MKKLLCYIGIAFSNIVMSQNNYILLDITENSNIRQNIAVILDSTSKIDLLNLVFKPIPGKYTSYRFIETYYGESPEFLPDSSVIIPLQDVLVLIVDKKDKIIDGYQYSLSYADNPSSCDLYRLANKRRKRLDSKFQLSSLKFRLINNPEYCGKDSILYLSQRNLLLR